MAFASAAIVSCTGGSGQVVEPRPDFKYGEGCTVPWGVAKVGELLYALNQQDVGAVERLFPATGDWDLEIGPSIARSLAAGHPLADTEADRATTQTAIPSLVYSLSGIHLVFTALPEGRAGPVEHVSPSGSVTLNEVDLGPVGWVGVGPALVARGRESDQRWRQDRPVV